jgi:hypothetical protein
MALRTYAGWPLEAVCPPPADKPPPLTLPPMALAAPSTRRSRGQAKGECSHLKLFRISNFALRILKLAHLARDLPDK